MNRVSHPRPALHYARTHRAYRWPATNSDAARAMHQSAMLAFRLIDTERVIQEVKTHECLWNPRDPQYKHKSEKYKAWEEVSEAVLPQFATCNENEQDRIMRAVQSRWKTARDAYMKCRITELKKPTYKSRQHKYIYQEQLRFLEQVKDIDEGKSKDEDESSNSCIGENSTFQPTFPVSDDDAGENSDMDFDIDIHDDFNDKIKTDNIAFVDVNDKATKEENFVSLAGTSSQNIDDIDDTAAEDKPSPARKRFCNAQPRKIKNKMSDFETRLLKILRLKNTLGPSSALQADDQSFFNSLAPVINNFNNHQKLQFRSKILEAVMVVGNTGRVNVKQEIETFVFDDVNDDKN